MFEIYLLATVISLFLALGLNVVISHNPVYSILYLVLFFVTGSSLLALFGFDYLSLIFILVYVGAIAVLFLFVVMILDLKILNKSGFDATFLVLICLSLFLLPIFYLGCGLTLYVDNIYLEFLFNIFNMGSTKDLVELIDSPIDSFLVSNIVSLNLCSDLFMFYEQYLLNLELFSSNIVGFYDYLILLKFIFCKHGFIIPESNVLINQSLNLLKIDYDSSVKNFQILYTDFTVLFIICGGVLLIAMTSCISLALPSRQYFNKKYINRRFLEN